jgi:hypothetical protein
VAHRAVLVVLNHAPTKIYHEFTFQPRRRLFDFALGADRRGLFLQLLGRLQVSVVCGSGTPNTFEEMEEDIEDVQVADITSEVTITEARARFTGTYSDIHVGRFRNQIVRLQNTH